MKQLKVSLRDELREQLDAAIESTGQSLAEEIRTRLERTFAEESRHDPETRELAKNIMELAAEIPRHAKAQWHQHPEAHAALKMAIQVFLEARVPQPNPSIASGFARGMQEAVACGSVLATNFIHNKKRNEELEAMRARVKYLERQSKRTGGKP